MKLPSINKDWLIMGGTAILAITGLVYLHNRFAGYVPTIPGISYGPGNPATGIYTGAKAPYSPVPIAQDVYGPIGSTAGPLVSQGIGAVRGGIGGIQSMWGGAQSSGNQGRGSYRDNWTDVYQNKSTALITHDDPDKRISLA